MVQSSQTGKKSVLGFTFIGLLMVVAISGIALSGVGIVWQNLAQQEREKELLFIGEEFRKGIASYYENSPNGVKIYPKNLQELILDKRLPYVKRHLRKIYIDPMTKKEGWGLIKQQNKIYGVYSLSTQVPIKRGNFSEQYQAFEKAKTYQDWKFVYNPNVQDNSPSKLN